MGFISLDDEIRFMLISSRHICIRSMQSADKTFTDFLRDQILIIRLVLYFLVQRWENKSQQGNDKAAISMPKCGSWSQILALSSYDVET